MSMAKKAMTIEDLAQEMKIFATDVNRKFEELGVVVEDNNSKLGLLLEYTTDIVKRNPMIDKMAEDIETLKDDVSALKVGQSKTQKRHLPKA